MIEEQWRRPENPLERSEKERRYDGYLSLGASFCLFLLFFFSKNQLGELTLAVRLLITAVLGSLLSIMFHKSPRRRRHLEQLGLSPVDAGLSTFAKFAVSVAFIVYFFRTLV